MQLRYVCIVFVIMAGPATAASCVDIGTNGTIYRDTVLTEDVFSPGDCIAIGADNLTLDCAGHGIVGGGGGKGAYVFGVSGARIRNCKIRGFNYGVYASFSTMSLLELNDVRDCNIGVYLSSSSSMLLNKNEVHKSGTGFYLYDVSNSEIVGCRANGNGGHGIEVRNSFSNKVSGGDFSENHIGIGVYSSAGMEVSRNRITGCYDGLRTDAVRGLKFFGNQEDILSGHTADWALHRIREGLTLFFVCGVLVALFVFLKKGRGEDVSFEALGINNAGFWSDWRKKRG